MNSGLFSQARASFRSPSVPRTFESTAASSGASKMTEAAEWITTSTPPRELREVLFAKPQRRCVYISLQDADLLGDMILEVVAQLLAQDAHSRGAEDILLEPLCGALATGGPDDEVETPEVREGAQDLLDQRRPQEAGPSRKQYLLVLVRLAEQLAPLLCPLAYLPLGALQEGSRVLPVPPQD